MPSIRDVARLAGVSTSTARRAIHQPKLLAPKTLERVLKAIDTLQYEPDQMAGALRKGRSTTIGMVVGNIMEPFFAELIRSVAGSLMARDYALIFAENQYRVDIELQQLRMLHGHRVSGLILRSGFGTPNLEYLRKMHERGTRIIHIDYFFQGSPFGYVMLDNAAAVELGVEYLHSLGHRRIAPLATYDPVVSPEERSSAFPQAMAKFGLTIPPEYQRVVSLADADYAYKLTTDLMRLDVPPTALFALTGNQGLGAYRALKDLGIDIPGEVSLLTFDTYPWMTLVEPNLDSIEQPVDEMGKAAVNALLREVVASEPVEKTELRFPGTLRRRASCAPPPG